MSQLMMIQSNAQVLSIIDVANVLKQSHKTLQRWDDAGILPATLNVYGNRVYDKDAVLYMKQALDGPTRKDVAKKCKVSEATVRIWEKTGALKPSYEIGRTVYYDEYELASFIKRRGEQL